MAKQKQKQKQSPPDPGRQQPGPGKSTSEAAFNELRREIAQRNERAHQQAREARTIRERERQSVRRERDL
jgi:hypothetical protein